jgi:DNA-binding transcriptional regulator YhcF (GntR family)
MSNDIVVVNKSVVWPNGFCMSDNRIEDCLQRFISPTAYCIWRQYLRFWGGNKNKAYPSLAYLSKVTGISERTIRKVNRELVEKGYLKKTSGHSNKSNTYYYVEVSKILKRYESKLEKQEAEIDANPPISEIEIDSSKVQKLIDGVSDKEAVFVNIFLGQFKARYKDKFGIEYNEDENDVKSIISNFKGLMDNVERFINLIEIFFKPDEYLDTSDRSIYFFFRPKTIKALASKYLQTDVGRWDAQADKIWEEKLKPIATKETQIDAISRRRLYSNDRDWIKAHVKFGSANTARDVYVMSSLLKKLYSFRDT